MAYSGQRPYFLFLLKAVISVVLVGVFYVDGFAQSSSVTISGRVIDKAQEEALPYVRVALYSVKDNSEVKGVMTDEEGRFALADVKPQKYILKISYIGYTAYEQSFYVGTHSDFLDAGIIALEEDATALDEVMISRSADGVSARLDKKTFSLDNNISQKGGSVLQVMKNLPGITAQGDKLKLRGSDQITILIDGKQTAITGYDNPEGLDNIPASHIEKIEIINHPSSKYDASGNAGIINIITRKNEETGFNGKLGLSLGLGSLWERRENFPDMSPQYRYTPKANPALSLNYRKEKLNVFAQFDDFYTESLSSNEFTTRTYQEGTVIRQQLKRNKKTNYLNSKAGISWFIDEQNTFTVAGSFTRKTKTNDGEQPFFNEDLSERHRFWKMFENDHKTLGAASADYAHKFTEAGHSLGMGANYSFTRRDKDYDFENILPGTRGTDAFELLSDEHVYDFNIDYSRPLQQGKLDLGTKLKYRYIPSDMHFISGENSVIDRDAGGWADYKELIPAVYSNYNYESEKWIAEVGIRLEYMKIRYEVDPTHNTYKSDRYDYVEPFFNTRLGYKLNEDNTLSLSYNRRVDRPREKDLRIFPKYDDAEILKVGNPALKPQFTNAFELGYKTQWARGYFYAAAYQRIEENTLTRIATTLPDEDLIYAVFQNAGKSFFGGFEFMLTQKLAAWYGFDANTNIYRHKVNAFTVENLYPAPQVYSADEKSILTGDVKINNNFRLPKGIKLQLSYLYLAPNLLPQGKERQGFSIDLGLEKSVQNGNGELFFNANDLFNTQVVRETIQGKDFAYTTRDYQETQIFRVGYHYTF